MNLYFSILQILTFNVRLSTLEIRYYYRKYRSSQSKKKNETIHYRISNIANKERKKRIQKRICAKLIVKKIQKENCASTKEILLVPSRRSICKMYTWKEQSPQNCPSLSSPKIYQPAIYIHVSCASPLLLSI